MWETIVNEQSNFILTLKTHVVLSIIFVLFIYYNVWKFIVGIHSKDINLMNDLKKYAGQISDPPFKNRKQIRKTTVQASSACLIPQHFFGNVQLQEIIIKKYSTIFSLAL